MKIIVEGCDGVGKDTFINNLSEILGIDSVRGSSFEISNGGADSMFKKSKDILDIEGNIIINRFFYSNLVYGDLYDYPMMRDEQYEQLNKMVQEKAIVYYLVADTEIIQQRINNRGDDMISPDDIDMIKQKYVDVWKKYHSNVVVIVTNSNELLNKNSDIYQVVIDNISEVEYMRDALGGV